MRGFAFKAMAVCTAGALLCASPALAAKVIALGTDQAGASDPVAACGGFAASPYEPGYAGRGLDDEQIFLDGALAACESARAAAPESTEVSAWLGRVYALIGRAEDAAVLLDAAAAGGNGLAAFVLSGLLSNGVPDGVDDDPERAFGLLQQATDAGFAPAALALGGRYESGTGVEIDYAEARRLYGIASAQGMGVATYKLGFLDHAGFGAEPDYAAAMALYEQAIAQGEPLGWNGVGQLYQYGQGVDVDNTRAAAAYQQGADAGEMMSQTALAYLYEQGLGVPQDFDKSFALLTSAANQNYGFGQAALALHYLFGQGTPVDPGKAFDLTSSAQAKGVMYANGILGYLYAEGLGTERNLSTALFYFRDGEAGGDQYSASRVPVTEAELACQDAAGSPYEPGGYARAPEFETLDAESAIATCLAALQLNAGSVGDGVWLARAYLKAGQVGDALPLLEAGVAADNALALVLSADLLMAGNGVDADPARALELYERAVGQGFAPAKLALGQIYAAGDLVPRDIERAKTLFAEALDAGVEAASAELAGLDGGPEVPVNADLDVGFAEEGPAY